MSYVVISVLMVACIVLVAASVRTKPEQMIKRQPISEVLERDAELRSEAIINFKPRRLNGRGKNYRAKRRAGKCRAKGR